MENNSRISRIKEHLLFYVIWILSILGLNFLVFSVGPFHYLSPLEDVLWFTGINLIIFIPVFLFRNMWLKSFAILILYIPAYYTLTGTLGLELEVIGIWFVQLLSLFILMGLIFVEHFKSKKSYVWLLIILIISLAIFGTYVSMMKKFNSVNQTKNQIRSGSYRNLSEAISICENFKKDDDKNACFFDVAGNEKNIDLCNRIVNVPNDSYSHNVRIQSCKTYVEYNIKNSK